MDTIDLIRAEVSKFHQDHGFGRSAADAFPAWWLHRRFELAGQEATGRTADGAPGDFGLDAFHLHQHPERGLTLHLVQAKFSENRQELKKAIIGFERTMQEVQRIFSGVPSEAASQHRIIPSLAAAIQRHPEAVQNIRIEFEVLHLCSDEDQMLDRTIAGAHEKFSECAQTLLGNHVVNLNLNGPEKLLPREPAPVNLPAQARVLRFEGVELKTSGATRYFAGLGYLSDLVDLYRDYGEQLFSKNVRFFNFKGLEKGPARHIRETLRTLCMNIKESSPPPERFAMFHNGVTVHAKWVEKTEGQLSIRSPNVLNGCQTIKSAFLFTQDPKNKARIDENRWRSIPIPVRVVVTYDEDFVRHVTVSNNRQTAIRPSAFRANDPVQLRLAERFAERKIFYERQEGAFENHSRAKELAFEELYSNSRHEPLKMEELAQAIAVVSDQPALSVASKLSNIFEDATYKRVFDEDKLGNLELLVFLRNVLRVVPFALKDVKDKTTNLEGLSRARFTFPVTKILARYIVKTAPKLVTEYGSVVLGRTGPTHPLRDRLKKLMAAQNTGLQQLLYEIWRDPKQDLGWKSATDQDCIQRALKKTKTEGLDVFASLGHAEADR